MINLEQVFAQTAFCRAFEKKVAEAVLDKRITYPVYLSHGTEHIAATVAAFKRDWAGIFCQHRGHSWLLSMGGNPDNLIRQLLYGPQGSASINDKFVNYFGHSGFVSDQVAIACGHAYATRQPVLCVMGDGGLEEDYVLASLGFAATHKLPVTFIVEDNDMSITTNKADRRSWDIVKVAESFGLAAAHCYQDNPRSILYCLNEFHYRKKLYGKTCLINIVCERSCWHAGVGKDEDPMVDRYQELKLAVGELGQGIEAEAIKKVNDLWLPYAKQ
jgi:TPP-dependent pyruvate/acetoin dehydrogenase alpha subunit